MADRKTYVCSNPACTLGSAHDSGRFTGGISQEQAHMLTGNPDAEHGPGVCPNCGKKCKAE